MRDCFISHSQQLRQFEPKKSLGTFGLLSILFIGTVGGAYGLEDCLRLGGPQLTVAGILLVPWVWSLPAALAVAELATSIPSNAGPIMWVSVAFPQWVSAACVMWTAALDIVDNSLYPALFADYLSRHVPLDWLPRLAVQGTLLGACALANVVGIEELGRGGAVVAAVSLLPFALLCLAEFPRLDTAPLTSSAPPPATQSLAAFIPMLAWNFSGFDNAGHVVEEVAVPGRTLVRALVLLCFTTQSVYLLPVVAGISTVSRTVADSGAANLSFSEWHDGHWVTVAAASGGAALGDAMAVGGMISAAGFTLAALCTTSRAIQGMATLGCLPDSLSRLLSPLHPRYKTPAAAIGVNAAVTFAASASLRFETLVAAEQVLYGIRLLLVLGACVVLRQRHPTLPRPFRIPGGLGALVLLLLPPLGFCSAVVVLGVSADPQVALLSGGAVLGSLVAGALLAAKGNQPFDGRIVAVPDEEGAGGSGQQQRRPHTPPPLLSPMLDGSPQPHDRRPRRLGAASGNRVYHV